MGKLCIVLEISKPVTFCDDAPCEIFYINTNIENLYITEFSTFRKGSKWENILWYLENKSKHYNAFSHIWFPSENTKINSSDISNFQNDLQNVNLCQPSIHKSYKTKYTKHIHSKSSKYTQVKKLHPDILCFSTHFINSYLIPFLNTNRSRLSNDIVLNWIHKNHSKYMYVFNSAIVIW